VNNGDQFLSFNFRGGSGTDRYGLYNEEAVLDAPLDNCPASNPCQEDADNDGVGDICDNCPAVPNPGQSNCDNDELGDACDPDFADADSDGIDDNCDNCPNDSDNDADGDGLCGDVDNCPYTAKPNQEDADSDGIGDVCDPDTIYGTISGYIQAGVTVDVYIVNCGKDIKVGSPVTNSEGYYAFGGLVDARHVIVARADGYTFVPKHSIVDIPQAVIQPHDFTASDIACADVDRFLDNGDGTVTDCRTNLIWLKDANCKGQLWLWKDFVDGLAVGECGLSDGSEVGSWRIPSLNEMKRIGTDPPTSSGWIMSEYYYYPTVIWTMPDDPFINVQTYMFYIACDRDFSDPRGDCETIRMDLGHYWIFMGYFPPADDGYYVWPVRDPN
jgi:hypothetical protein